MSGASSSGGNQEHKNVPMDSADLRNLRISVDRSLVSIRCEVESKQEPGKMISCRVAGTILQATERLCRIAAPTFVLNEFDSFEFDFPGCQRSKQFLKSKGELQVYDDVFHTGLRKVSVITVPKTLVAYKPASHK